MSFRSTSACRLKKERKNNSIKKLLRKKIEEEFIIRWKDNILSNTETIFLLQSFGNQRYFRAIWSYACYLNGSSAFLMLMLDSQEKRTTDTTPEADSGQLFRGSGQIFWIPCCLLSLFFMLLGKSPQTGSGGYSVLSVLPHSVDRSGARAMGWVDYVRQPFPSRWRQWPALVLFFFFYYYFSSGSGDKILLLWLHFWQSLKKQMCHLSRADCCINTQHFLTKIPFAFS